MRFCRAGDKKRFFSFCGAGQANEDDGCGDGFAHWFVPPAIGREPRPSAPSPPAPESGRSMSALREINERKPQPEGTLAVVSG